MKIFVLRHGLAEAQKTTDEMRNLTEQGRRDVAQSVERSLSDLRSIKNIIASPLVRAQQTAKIASEILLASGLPSSDVSINTSELIVPEANPRKFLEYLESKNIEAVLVVSHMPFVGNFLDVICGCPAGFHSMNTSSLALIECDHAAADFGKLLWNRHVYE